MIELVYDLDFRVMKYSTGNSITIMFLQQSREAGWHPTQDVQFKRDDRVVNMAAKSQEIQSAEGK